MEIFLKLYAALLPVVAFVGVGYLLKKKTNISTSWVSPLLIKVLMPILVIYHVSQTEVSKIAIIPAITFLLALTMNLPAYLAHRSFAKKANYHLLSCAFAFFNVAFFGLPTVKALFGENEVPTLICIYIGTALYGDTIGYFQVARTKLSVRESLMKVLKIPLLYTFVVAIAGRLLGLALPSAIDPAMGVIGWIVSALGMTIIGVNLVGVDFGKLSPGYLGKVFGLRILSAVLILGLLLWLEHSLIGQLEGKDLKMLALLPFFPVAANVTVFASFLKTEEERSALLVGLSLLIALVLVPLVARFMM